MTINDIDSRIIPGFRHHKNVAKLYIHVPWKMYFHSTIPKASVPLLWTNRKKALRTWFSLLWVPGSSFRVLMTTCRISSLARNSNTVHRQHCTYVNVDTIMFDSFTIYNSRVRIWELNYLSLFRHLVLRAWRSTEEVREVVPPLRLTVVTHASAYTSVSLT